MMKFILVIAVVAALFESCIGSGWGYRGEKGPSKWFVDFTKCGGKSQSPIDIKTSDTQLDKKLGVFQRKWFQTTPNGMMLKNNGHSAQVDVTNGLIINDTSVLPGTYQLAQFHYHWGSSPANGGSEHTINGKHSFGEMHMVFWNKKYGDIGTAKSKTGDGLAVLGFMIEATYPQDNCAFDRVFGHLSGVDQKDEKRTYQTSELFALETLLPNDLSQYYRYRGSLTTPTCDESVVWTIFKEPIQISKAQATKIADTLREGTENNSTVLQNNYRPTQALNGRIVYYNSAVATKSSFGICLVIIATILTL